MGTLPLGGLPLLLRDVSVPGEPGPIGLDVGALERVREGLRRRVGVRIAVPGATGALGDEFDAHRSSLFLAGWVRPHR